MNVTIKRLFLNSYNVYTYRFSTWEVWSRRIAVCWGQHRLRRCSGQPKTPKKGRSTLEWGSPPGVHWDCFTPAPCTPISPHVALALWKTLDQKPQGTWFLFLCLSLIVPSSQQGRWRIPVHLCPLSWRDSKCLCWHHTNQPIFLFQDESPPQLTVESLKGNPHLSSFISSPEAPLFFSYPGMSGFGEKLGQPYPFGT